MNPELFLAIGVILWVLLTAAWLFIQYKCWSSKRMLDPAVKRRARAKRLGVKVR